MFWGCMVHRGVNARSKAAQGTGDRVPVRGGWWASIQRRPASRVLDGLATGRSLKKVGVATPVCPGSGPRLQAMPATSTRRSGTDPVPFARQGFAAVDDANDPLRTTVGAVMPG